MIFVTKGRHLELNLAKIRANDQLEQLLLHINCKDYSQLDLTSTMSLSVQQPMSFLKVPWTGFITIRIQFSYFPWLSCLIEKRFLENALIR